MVRDYRGYSSRCPEQAGLELTIVLNSTLVPLLK
jgi:hypothetical protein